MRRLSIVLAALALVACEHEPVEDGPGAGGDVPVDGDAGACSAPQTGCPCEPGSPPIDCYADPVYEGDTILCSEGARYCRAGTWSQCELLRDYTLSGGIAALRDGPSPCNPCNPDCSVARDYPTDSDLPGHSTDVVYDPSEGGITLDDGGSTSGSLPDTDGDGVPDEADDCSGTGWRAPCDGSASDDGFYHTLPYGGPAELDPLTISTMVRTADVYFLMDTTGSMGGEISNLQSSLTSGTYISGCPGGIIGAIRCTIPDAWFGVGYHDDYPVSPYGSGGWGDAVYRNILDITSSVGATQTAVNTLVTHSGADWPESQGQALWAISMGSGLGPYLPDRGACPPGQWGYPCFRNGTIPIVILFTDAPFHNGPSGNCYGFGDGCGSGGGCDYSSDPACRTSVCSYDPYCCGAWGGYWDSICDAEAATDPACTCSSGGGGTCSATGGGPLGYPVYWCQTVAALNDNGVKVITVNSGSARTDAVSLANSTGSTDSSGSPFVFDISSDGSGLGTAVVSAVEDLANYSRMDVTARGVDNPATAGVDERCFIDAIRAVSYPSGRCTGISGGDTFLECLPGTMVDFEITFRNDCVMPTSVPQVFDFWIEIVGDGSYVLDTVPVRMTVPPEVPTYPPDGAYWRDYDASSRCTIPPKRPDWDDLVWTASTPPDSSIRFEIRTASTAAGLPGATPTYITVPPDSPPVDIGDLLTAAGRPANLPHLRVTARLFASTDRTVSPVLTGFELSFRCVTGE